MVFGFVSLVLLLSFLCSIFDIHKCSRIGGEFSPLLIRCGIAHFFPFPHNISISSGRNRSFVDCLGKRSRKVVGEKRKKAQKSFGQYQSTKCVALSRRDRIPCLRRILPSLFWEKQLAMHGAQSSYCCNAPSSFFSSSAGAASSAAPPAAAPPAAGAAAAPPPPEPTFRSMSLTSLPSRALANRVAQMGSTSGTPAALMRVFNLSAYTNGAVSNSQMFQNHSSLRTVISMPSSARMRAA